VTPPSLVANEPGLDYVLMTSNNPIYPLSAFAVTPEECNYSVAVAVTFLTDASDITSTDGVAQVSLISQADNQAAL